MRLACAATIAATDMTDFSTTAQGQRDDVIGHSMGGAISLQSPLRAWSSAASLRKYTARSAWVIFAHRP